MRVISTAVVVVVVVVAVAIGILGRDEICREEKGKR